MISVAQVRLYVPLLGFVVPTLAMGYGIVLPRHGICGLNEITLGFGSTVFGAALTYVAGIRLARQTSCSRKPWRRRIAEYVNRQASSPRGPFGWLLGRIWRFEHRRVNQHTLAVLGIEPGQSVLELGCGSGMALAEATGQAGGGRVLGLDVSETMVAMATRRNRRAVEQGIASIRQIDGVNLDLEPRSFDRIFSVHTLYFWKNPPEILRQLRESLRNQGRLVLTSRPDGPEIPARFRDPTYRFYTEAEVETLLQQAGFTDIQLVRVASVVCAVASVPERENIAS
ncbi:MAG TPA: methyltransferase domain-containing protein [Polyangiaceae bacterium]|nr:methyltransferase domain-containing protein [Polyangiaceae bacterium]